VPTFEGVVEPVGEKYTMFLPDGTKRPTTAAGDAALKSKSGDPKATRKKKSP
jgi:hypothetical protein